MAVLLLRQANMARYGALLRELRDNRLYGMDLYPKNLDAAYTLLENHSSGRRKNVNNPDRNREPRSDMIAGIQYAH